MYTTRRRSINTTQHNTFSSGLAQSMSSAPERTNTNRTLILLHGSRQTGDLLLGRVDKLRRRLASQQGVDLVAPTARFAHAEQPDMCSWWKGVRTDGSNIYDGLLDTTIPQLVELWRSLQQAQRQPIGFMGFSQGARLAHLLTLLHERRGPSSPLYFDGLQCVVMVAGYEAPLPADLEASHHPDTASDMRLHTPSLHVWGETDRLITPAQSQGVTRHYHPQYVVTHVHDGGHHVPMRAVHVRTYMDFVAQHATRTTRFTTQPVHTKVESQTTTTSQSTIPSPASSSSIPTSEPDGETKQIQVDEVQALEAIFPDEFQLLSARCASTDNDSDISSYIFPLEYQIALDATDEGVWPPKPLTLHVSYPPTYPTTAFPTLDLIHANHVLEFSSAQRQACHAAMMDAVQAQEGMPCVYACHAALKEFFESGAMADITNSQEKGDATTLVPSAEERSSPSTLPTDTATTVSSNTSSNTPVDSIKPCSKERSEKCNLEGLQVAASLLKDLGTVKLSDTAKDDNHVHSSSATTVSTTNNIAKLKGGHWTYTIGLVGKPSAGKSTFFNAATAFARQRDDADNLLGGATMAPHPFTTIDPNVGFCLVPAPKGLCPEDDADAGTTGDWKVGSTHGRDHHGRRLLPVLLKDVAGLVPGAYQGRGRGNKFLNDLTDANVLVHVLDASGTADVEGNDLGVEEDGNPHGAASHPLNDMEWIRTELMEWVYANLMHKWHTVSRKGRSKLMGMFSGYTISHGLLWSILNAVEKFMEKNLQRDHALDRLEEWDEGDVRRLVSAFLGVRFPMALALNKSDLPTSAQHIEDIQHALPLHGAYSGTPLCARQEMSFIRKRLEWALAEKVSNLPAQPNEKIPEGVWSCLTAALSLHEPILVFPVTNFTDYAPLPGLTKYATEDPSLPSAGMVSCLQSAAGQAPSLWDPSAKQYVLNKHNQATPLRDALVMKPGSTVDDVFTALKNRRALDGEFVRAEASGHLGAPSRPIPKLQLLDKSNRILKIMTTKRTPWQHNYR